VLELLDAISLDLLLLATEMTGGAGEIDHYFRGLSGSSATRRLRRLLSRSSCAVWPERRAWSVCSTTFTGELCRRMYVLCD